ncbi:hypothetical protein [Paenibacillus sp. 23TSA30-6]|uniref:hypothetical protein n=1 Tax=Paenibacillus sp. 23TSA30-6 TaxID=2546104 RepID=UPI00192D7644|nr:hypothetical protein [Paenibacillus sp. 23TSA30-6]
MTSSLSTQEIAEVESSKSKRRKGRNGVKVEQDLEEIKDRLTQIEAKLERGSTSGRILKTMLIIFLSIFFLLLVIGVVQFVSNSSV